MTGDVPLFEAWRTPGWPELGERVALRVLPPARSGREEDPRVALAVPELGAEHAVRLASLLRGRRRALLDRPALEVARSLGRVGERFLSEGDPLRERALAALPGSAGVSPPMARAVLDGMARDWTAARLETLLRSDLGDPAVLDGFVRRGAVRVRALGPPFAFHVSAGSVPGVSATSLIRSLLVKTPVLVKPGRGDVVLPTLFLEGLAREDPDLARAAAVVYWPGGGDRTEGVEDVFLQRAGVVVVYGGDDVVTGLRSRIAPTTRMVAYHHRISFVVLGADAVRSGRIEGTAAGVARAVALFDQRGCVSPHAVFVEGPSRSEAFVEALSGALERLDEELPPGRMDEAEASALHQLRGTAELEAAAGGGVAVRSGGRSPWTVLLEPEAPLRPSCLNRVVRVVPVEDVGDVPGRVVGLSRHLQSAGAAGLDDDRLEELGEALARVGVLRVTTLEGMPFPPGWWRHDGRGPLDALVRWVELEGP